MRIAKGLSFHHTVDIPQRNAFHRHMHNEYEILYFLRGDAEYIIEGSVYKLKPGDLLFIAPRTFHYLNPLSESTYERFVINFSEEHIPSSCLDFAHRSKEIYHVPQGSVIDKFFESWLEAERQFSPAELGEFFSSSIFHIMLFLHHLPEEQAVTPIRAHRTLENILHYIDEHPTAQISAAELSQKFYVSTSWIVHSFRRVLGISLMQYIEKKRILFAQAKISGGLAPTEAAKHCSYENYSTFYRQYKKILGHSPAEDVSR